MKLLTAMTVSILTMGTLGCSGSSDWIRDRAHDLTDTMNIEATALTFGVGVNAGPAVLGLCIIAGPDKQGRKTRIGFGGIQRMKVRNDYYSGAIVPIRYLIDETRGTSGYGRRSPAWGSIGFNIGFWGGIGLRFDLVEMLDFIGGLFTVDILQDDHELKDDVGDADDRGQPDSAMSRYSERFGMSVPVGHSIAVQDPPQPTAWGDLFLYRAAGGDEKYVQARSIDD